MEAAILSSYTPLSSTADLRIRGKFAGCNLHFYNLPLNRTRLPLKLKFSESSRRHFFSRKDLILSNGRKELSSYFTHQLASHYTSIRASSGETLHYGQSSPISEGEGVSPTSTDANNFVSLQLKQKKFRNRFLNFVRLGSVIDNAAESFFKSEIRRRLFVTAILIVISRIGYFIPLPGFDRRLIPEDYLSFVSGSVNELGDSTPELKLSLFQLGVSPQIAASILMQVLCHVLPSLVKLRKEGLDGHEKIKSYIWWISLGFAILEALILSCYSLPYSIYAASHRVKHVLMTSFLLVSGAMTMSWICDTITESGFGQGSTLIICVGILTGYTDTLQKMLTQIAGSSGSWWPINSSQQQQQFHAQPINNSNNPLNSSSSCFISHPWPEWCSFISVLTANGQLAPAVEDSFVAYEELSDDFVRAASVCLTFARERPDLIGSLSRRDIEIVVSNGTPFLFKAALETARRMRAFLGIGGSTVLDCDNANTSDLMKYILSYASKPTVSSENNSLYGRELIESSCRNLLLELVEVSCGTPAVNLPSPEQYQFSGRYGQTPRPIRQNLVMKRGDWICQRCNFMNFARNNKCLECEEPRPRRQLTGGEWECPQCYFFNYGRNVVCLKCDFGRPAGVSLGTTHSSSATGFNGNSAYANGIDPRLAENEEKAQRWFSKVSQMNNASDIDSAAADEDFPEIMPLRKGENKFVVSTRKTPLERRLANSQYNMNLGNNVIPEGETLTGAANNIIDTSMKQNMDQTSRTSYSGIAADENTESAIYHRGKSSNHVPFVPLPTDMFDKKNQTSVMDEKVNEKAGIFHSPETSHQTSSASVGNDFGTSVEKLESNRPFSKDKEREQAEKSASWFKKIAELHDVKDLPSAISDDDFPEIMPMRKGENRFVVSKKKDRSLTSPMYKRQVAMEQANNSSFVPFVPFPPGYFAKKDTQQADNADSSSVSRVETSSISSSKTYSETADVEKTHQKSDDPGYKFTDMNTVQRTDDRFTSSRFASSNFSGDQGFPHIGNIGETSLASDASSTDSSGSRNSVKDDVSPSETGGVGSPQLPGNQNIRSGWSGKSLEGSAVKEPDPLDMSEEAKAERWFRRVAQIKDISELSQIPDEDFPSIMPMRKGVNRFVVSKRKTPLERRLTSTQYRRNLPVVSSDPIKRESDNSEK